MNVAFISAENLPASICITDLVGKTLLLQNDKLSVGDNLFNLDVSGISSGIYMIEVINGDQTSIQKIMIE